MYECSLCDRDVMFFVMLVFNIVSGQSKLPELNASQVKDMNMMISVLIICADFDNFSQSQIFGTNSPCFS